MIRLATASACLAALSVAGCVPSPNDVARNVCLGQGYIGGAEYDGCWHREYRRERMRQLAIIRGMIDDLNATGAELRSLRQTPVIYPMLPAPLPPSGVHLPDLSVKRPPPPVKYCLREAPVPFTTQTRCADH